MPIYVYKNPKTDELIEKLRPMKDSGEPLILEDGTICQRDISAEHSSGIKAHRGIDGKTAELWDVDPEYVKAGNPKFIKTRNGTRLSRKEYWKYL